MVLQRRLKVVVLEGRGLRVDRGARVVARRRVRLIVVPQVRMMIARETVGRRFRRGRRRRVHRRPTAAAAAVVEQMVRRRQRRRKVQLGGRGGCCCGGGGRVRRDPLEVFPCVFQHVAKS